MTPRMDMTCRRRGSQRTALRRRVVVGDGGNVATEYLGVFILIGVVVAALIAAGIPSTVGDWGRYAACQLFTPAAGCTAPDGTTTAAVPLSAP